MQYINRRNKTLRRLLTFLSAVLFLTASARVQKFRARDIGIPFNGTPGKFNAITDVKGVEVGYSTIISGSGKNIRSKGPVRTGVTAILPRGRNNNPVFARCYKISRARGSAQNDEDCKPIRCIASAHIVATGFNPLRLAAGSTHKK